MFEFTQLNVTPEIDPESGAQSNLNFAERREDQISSQGIAFAGLIGFFSAWLIMAGFQMHQMSQVLVIFLSFTALPMVAISILLNKAYLRSSTGLAIDPKPINWKRCRIKFIGFLATVIFVGLFYKVIPEYSRSFYHPVWEVVVWLALPVMSIAFPYIVWVDRRMLNPTDGYWNAGLLMLGRWQEVNRIELRHYGMGWLIKGFFFPFMLGGAAEHINLLPVVGINLSNFDHFYASTMNVAYAIDVVFGSIGYLLTIRLIDSHIQSIEHTLLGWLCTLSCYVPFSTLIWTYILSYKGKTDWSDWMAPYPVLFITWGFAIIVTSIIYVWSTCSFGCRFSNLTNRGIITDGPYRCFKHPAYLSKNIAWWMISVPFIAHHNLWDASRACACLLLTNVIYAIRALTEERHLLRDPAYQAYYAWMEQYGVGAQLRNVWRKLRRNRLPATNS